MNNKSYRYTSKIYPSNHGGAYTIFPFDIREEFGKGRVKVYVTFDGYPYEGSIVNMGVKDDNDKVCYIVGIRKDIQQAIAKGIGSSVNIVLKERE